MGYQVGVGLGNKVWLEGVVKENGRGTSETLTNDPRMMRIEYLGRFVKVVKGTHRGRRVKVLSRNTEDRRLLLLLCLLCRRKYEGNE